MLRLQLDRFESSCLRMTFFFCVFDVVSAAFSDVVVGGAGGLTAGVAVTAAF